MSQVHWSMGQVLLPEHFSLQQNYMHQLNGHINGIVNNCDDGVLDIVIDKAALSQNILKFTSLAMFIPNKKFISLEFNAICKNYDLDPKKTEDGRLSLYLILKDELNIQLNKINNHDIETEYYDFYLSDSFVSKVDYSVKLFELIYVENIQQWQVDSYIPKCILLPHVFARSYLESATKKLSTIKEKLKYICINKNLHDNYQAVYLKLSEIEFWIGIQKLDCKPLQINALRRYLYQLYQCTSFVWDNKTSFYEVCLQPLKDCDKLLELIDGYFKLKLKNPSTYHLEYKQGIHQSGILNDDFFIAEIKYLVYQNNSSSKSNHLLLVKGFAPSKAEDILLKSLPGIELKAVDKKFILDKFANAEQVFEIIQHGSQWQAVLEEKVFCLKSNIVDNRNDNIYLSFL
ncbi:MAG: type VI secretion system protein ImpJ [Francisella sp.]|jgi:type VI secretion system protein ImpJ